MITGTLADTINPPDSLPPEYMFDPNEDLVLEDLWEGYDWGIKRQEQRKLEEAINKSTCIFKYFLATVDHPEDRTFEKFNDSGYNLANLNRTDWNNNSFTAKKLTVDELKARIAKAEGKGNYSTPITASNGQKYASPDDDPREDFNEEGSDDDSAETKFLRDLRNAIADFDAKGSSIEEIVHAKFDKIYQTSERVASGRSLKQFAFIYGQPGIGKSYTVAKAVKKGVEKWNTARGPKPTIETAHGAIGASPTPLIVFFFKNRANKVIILDDADGFVTSTNDDVQNILKCLMDPDGYALTTPSTIRQGATKLYRKEMGLDECLNTEIPEVGTLFTVDTSKVDEGILKYRIGGLLYECNVTKEEAAQLKECFPMHKVTEAERKAYEQFREAMSGKPLCRPDGKVMTLKEQDTFIQGIDLNSITSDNMAAAVMNADGSVADEIADEIPSSFYFTSRMIMISNLNREDLNDAIQSRCDCIPIYLNRQQFLFRAEEVLNWINVSKTTLTEPELVDWAKRESFAIFKACMNDLNYKNSKINMRIGIRLELRIIASLAGLLLARFDTWCEKKGITDYLKPEVYQQFENDQKVYFIKYDLLPYMAGDLEADFSED